MTMLRIRLVVVRLPGALGDRVEAARIPAVGVVAVVARVVVVRPAALAAEAGLVSRHLSHPGSVVWERCCRGRESGRDPCLAVRRTEVSEGV